MRGSARALLALLFGVVAACGPLLGLDDLYERPRADAGDAGDGDSGGPADPDGGAAACTKNIECKPPNGSAALCVSGRCVRVADFCLPEVLPNNKVLEDDDVALFAAFLPFQGGQAPLSQAPALAYALAIDELAVGIPYIHEGSVRRRKVALVLCPSEPDVIEASVAHVTHDLRVHAMIASFDNATLPSLVQNHAAPEGVFTLNPSTATEALRYPPHPLVWNLLGVPEDVATAYRPLVEGVQTMITTGSDEIKVALLTTNTSMEESVRNVLSNGRQNMADGTHDASKALRFNGKDLPDMTGGYRKSHFRSIAVPAEEKGQSPDYIGIKNELLSFGPQVVIALTVNEIARVVSEVDPLIEPMWILGPRNAEYVRSYLADGGAAAFARKQPRFLGVQYAGAEDPTHRSEWLARMENKYGPPGEVDYSASENFYDAVYWLAYGAAYPEGGALTGETISRGIRRLIAGPDVFPGLLAAVSNAFTVLGLGGGGTFVGALGRPDIDEKHGTWNSVGGVYCYEASASGVLPKYDVLRYVRDSGKLAIRSQCFPNQFDDFGL